MEKTLSFGVWTDIGPSGGYELCLGEEPKAQYVEDDPRFGTTAVFVDMAPDFSWASTELAGNQTLTVTATIKGLPNNWRVLIAALLAAAEVAEI